jgi:hypothetical protein
MFDHTHHKHFIAKHEKNTGDHEWKKNWEGGRLPESHFETIHQPIGIHMPVLHQREEENLAQQAEQAKLMFSPPSPLPLDFQLPLKKQKPPKSPEKPEEKKEDEVELDVVMQWRLKRGYGVNLKSKSAKR